MKTNNNLYNELTKEFRVKKEIFSENKPNTKNYIFPSLNYIFKKGYFILDEYEEENEINNIEVNFEMTNIII
ncbi:hypothetical protein [Metamycoplasma equirhinis]|uniref:hypothetical protein n=1 Tax=Metamycoplasma equirhinis TaxID=92402 RepID=UPI003593197B